MFRNGNVKRGAVNNAKGFSGTLTINGGEFENTYDGVGYSILDSDEGTTEVKPQININGGAFKDAIGFSKPANTTTVITVRGGSFAFDPAVYLADGFIAEENNGVYTVTAAAVQPTEPPAETGAPTQQPTEPPAETGAPTQQPTEPPAATGAPTQQPEETEPPQTSQEPTVTYEDGAVRAVFNGLTGDGMVYAAEYAGDGRLVSVKAQALSEEVVIPFEKTGEVKVFIWDLEQKPLYNRVFVLE
jgi:hypothetical protein